MRTGAGIRSRCVTATAALSVAVGSACTASGTGSGDDGVPPPRDEPGEPAELASCDVLPAGTPEPTSPDDDGHEPVTVTLWYAEDDKPSALLAELVDEFEAAHPDIEVEMLDVGPRGRAGVLDDWRATAPENRPSLAIMAEEATRLLADSGQAVAPGRCLAEAVPELVPSIAAGWSVDGIARAVPFAVSTPVLVYNRRAFRDAGLDPDRPPTSPDELRAAAEQLVERGTVPVGMVFDTRSDGVPGWLVEHWGAQAGVVPLATDGGGDGTGGRAAWQDGPALDHFRWLEQMVADGLAASIGTNAGGITDLAALVDERPRAAMAFHTSGALGELTDYVDTGDVGTFELGVAPLPGPGSGSLPGGAALWLATGQPADETQAAWTLAAHLASPDAQARLAAISGYAPVTRAAPRLEPLRSTWATHPHMALPYQVLDALDTSQVELSISVGPEREIKELLAEALRATLRDGDPAAALAAAAADADQLLDAYEEGLTTEDG